MYQTAQLYAYFAISVFLFINKTVSEYKNSSLFYLSAEYSLFDCHKGDQ